MTDWYIGTMGFGYKDWKGPFYPADLDADDFLSYYSRAFNAVEVDSTFYGTPRPDTVRRWSAVTPPEFRFSAKVPRVITHDLVLVGAAGLMDEFLDTMRLLEEKLAVILIQFPPSFSEEQAPALESFLETLPGDIRFAVEVRHRSWYTPEAKTAELLGQRGVCWAATDYPGLPVMIRPVTSFQYIRWVGQHGTYQHHEREQADRMPELSRWWEIIQKTKDQFDTVYGFFNNDYAGHAPATANRFKEIAGLPVDRPRPPQQTSLF